MANTPVTTDATPHGTHCITPSGVLEGYRLHERLEWVEVPDGGDADAEARRFIAEWRQSLSSFGYDIVWSRFVVQERAKGHAGNEIAKVWMIAGVRKRKA